MDEERKDVGPLPGEAGADERRQASWGETAADSSAPDTDDRVAGETAELAPGEMQAGEGVPLEPADVPPGQTIHAEPADMPVGESWPYEPAEGPSFESAEATPGERQAPEAPGATPETGRVDPFGTPEPGMALPPPAFSRATQDDRTLAALAHASIVLNLVTGFGGLIAAALIWLVYRDRSKYVADQGLQATVFQGLWLLSWAVIGMVWVVVGLLSAVVVGLCLIPFALILTLLPIVAFFYPFYAALQTYEGRDFKYPWIGNLVRGMV